MIPIRRFSILLCAALLMVQAVPAALAQEGSSNAAQTQGAYDGYIVKLRDEAPLISTFASADASWPTNRCLVVDTLEQAAQIPAEYVEYIEPNYLIELFTDEDVTSSGADSETTDPVDTSPFPSDPYYADYQWSLQQIGALSAYQRGLMGEGVRIGFVDSGINRDHEDLDSSRISGENFNSDGLQYNEDNYGHGTFSAGIVAAQTDNGLGLAGIAPKAEIKAYRVFSNKNATTAAVVAAIDQAIADGCDIINLSLGTPSPAQTLTDAIDRAAEAGIILVAAVGNSGSSTLQYPAAYTSVIGVGSVDEGSTLSSFSQRNSSVYVTAPGGGVAGLDYASTDGYLLTLSSASNRGTSYSAPIVTGMAALALGYDPDITDEGIRYLLKTTSTDLGTSGYDTSYGYGEVNVNAFIEELTRNYTVTFHLNEGTFSGDVLTSYQVTDDAIPLPVPTREGYFFLGWYTTDDLSGLAVTEIPAGSLGDKQFFAAWQDAATVAIDSVSVKGYTAQIQEDGTYTVRIPSATTVTADDIQIIAVQEGASLGSPVTTDDGQTWTFSVTYGSLTVHRTLHIQRVSAAEIGKSVMEAIQTTTGEDRVTLEQVPEDMTVAVSAYQNGKMVYLGTSTSGTDTTRTFDLPADLVCDSLRLFLLYEWMPVACDRQLLEQPAE